MVLYWKWLEAVDRKLNYKQRSSGQCISGHKERAGCKLIWSQKASEISARVGPIGVAPPSI